MLIKETPSWLEDIHKLFLSLVMIKLQSHTLIYKSDSFP